MNLKIVLIKKKSHREGKILNKLLYLKLNNGEIFIHFFVFVSLLAQHNFSSSNFYLDGIYVLLSLWPITEKKPFGNDNILLGKMHLLSPVVSDNFSASFLGIFLIHIFVSKKKDEEEK